VAVSSNGTNRVATSPDGITWTFQTAAAVNAWKSVCFGNGLFVAVATTGVGNRVMTSPDGVSWSPQISAANITWSSVCFGNGKFVAVASDGVLNCVMTSTNGSSWSLQAGIAGPLWRGVVYGNGLYVAVGLPVGGVCMMTSPNGSSWSIQHTPGDANFSFDAVTYGNNLFVAGGEAGGDPNIMTSTDGVTWNLRSTPQDLHLRSIAYGGGAYVAVADDGPTNLQTIYSLDGTTWNSLLNLETNTFYGIAYGNGRFVAVSQSGIHRADTMDVSENPNPTFNGIGQMGEYENSVSTGIDQVNTYHPLIDALISGTFLNGWTFLGPASGTFTSVANAGGGQITVNTPVAHGMLAGQIVFLTSSSVAGYRPPNPIIFIIQSVTATSFNVVATFTATATGNWSRGCSLTATVQAAGYYQIFWSVSCHSAGANKLYKFEPILNASNLDVAGASSLLTTTDVQCMGSSCIIAIAAGDIITMACNNQTDTTDVTIVDLNCRLIRFM
jgi:predicted RecA/RadA family phage recombinase